MTKPIYSAFCNPGLYRHPNSLSADTLRRPPIGNFRNLPRAAGCGHSTSRLCVLKSGVVYIRKNSTNCEAESDDIARFSNFYQHQTQDKPVAPAGAWSQLHRICDGFDPARVYVAVLNRSSDCDVRDWVAMAAVHWNAIIDFDAGTDSQGNSQTQKEPLGKTCSSSHGIGKPARNHVPVNSLDRRIGSSVEANSDIRSWNQSKVPRLEQIMNELARTTEARSGDSDYIQRRDRTRFDNMRCC